MDEERIKTWFIAIVLPMEAQLLSFFRSRWNNKGEVRDMLQDVYERALTGARQEIPSNGHAYVFAIARNLMISRAKRERIVSFEFIVALDQVINEQDYLTPERYASAREDLRRAIEGMEQLPPRCREMVRLRKVEGMTVREVAERMKVSVAAVERQLTLGMRALVDFMLGGSGQVKRDKRFSAQCGEKGARRD
jgi:RNA polymerase sigma-70 factor (ECF subfamily)